MTQKLFRQRAVVQASLAIPAEACDAAVAAIRQLAREYAEAYAGPMPPRGLRLAAWRTRVVAFEWLVFKRLYRETGALE